MNKTNTKLSASFACKYYSFFCLSRKNESRIGLDTASHRSTLKKLADYTNQKCHTQACLPTAWPVSTKYSELIFSDRCLGLIFWLLLHQGKSNKNMQGESLLT